jgi:hypothetical protein
MNKKEKEIPQYKFSCYPISTLLTAHSEKVILIIRQKILTFFLMLLFSQIKIKGKI